jgi:ankyrin repeat protein
MGGPQMIVDLARAGDLEELKAALAGGCSPNEKCARNASTPLIAAAGKGHLSIVKHVLGVGAELDHENDEGASAADAALAMGHQDVVKTLAKHELIGSTRLRFAVEQDDHEGLPQLLGR